MVNIWKKVDEDEKFIFSKEKIINKTNSLEILNEIYLYVKDNSRCYYNGKRMHPGYGIIREDLYYVESSVRGLIIDINDKINISEEPNEILELLVYLGRRKLIEKHYPNYLHNDYDIYLSDLNFTNYCKESADYIKKICDERNIKCYILPIYPGFTNRYNLYNGCGFHFANVILLNNKYYLIDITYSQFFYINTNSLERIGIVNLSGCKAGRFMLLDEDRKKVAINLLRDGYIELDENIFKSYLEGFTLSFRNGLYYENTNDLSFNVDYDIDTYIKFLKGEDNQVNYEGIDNLGYQKRPLQKKIPLR